MTVLFPSVFLSHFALFSQSEGFGAFSPCTRFDVIVKVVRGELLYRIVVVWKVLCQGVIFDSLVEWDSILLHAVEEWSGSNAAIDGFVIFDLGGCKIAVTAISIRSREKVGSVEGIGGVYSGRAPDLALRSLDSGWLAAHRTKDREISR